jgi:hypothetical protein
MNESTEILPVAAVADQPRRIQKREGRFTRLPPHDIDDADDVEMGSTTVSGGPVADNEAAGLLRQVPFMKHLEEEPFQRLCRAAELVEFGMNEVVVREGDPGDSIFIVRSGSFDVYKSTAGGRERVFTYYRPGDSFGEVCVLDANAVRTATVQAATRNTTCFKLRRADVKPVLDELSEAHRQRLADLWEIPAFNCGAKNSGSHSTRPTIVKAWVSVLRDLFYARAQPASCYL